MMYKKLLIILLASILVGQVSTLPKEPAKSVEQEQPKGFSALNRYEALALTTGLLGLSWLEAHPRALRSWSVIRRAYIGLASAWLTRRTGGEILPVAASMTASSLFFRGLSPLTLLKDGTVSAASGFLTNALATLPSVQFYPYRQQIYVVNETGEKLTVKAHTPCEGETEQIFKVVYHVGPSPDNKTPQLVSLDEWRWKDLRYSGERYYQQERTCFEHNRIESARVLPYPSIEYITFEIKDEHSKAIKSQSCLLPAPPARFLPHFMPVYRVRRVGDRLEVFLRQSYTEAYKDLVEPNNGTQVIISSLGALITRSLFGGLNYVGPQGVIALLGHFFPRLAGNFGNAQSIQAGFDNGITLANYWLLASMAQVLVYGIGKYEYIRVNAPITLEQEKVDPIRPCPKLSQSI
jgi:hypothetical protein